MDSLGWSLHQWLESSRIEGYRLSQDRDSLYWRLGELQCLLIASMLFDSLKQRNLLLWRSFRIAIQARQLGDVPEGMAIPGLHQQISPHRGHPFEFWAGIGDMEEEMLTEPWDAMQLILHLLKHHVRLHDLDPLRTASHQHEKFRTKIIYLRNVFLHPSQRQSLIKQAHIQIPVCSNLLTRQKAPWSNSIVEVDKNKVLARCSDDFRSIVIGVCVRVIPATLDVHPYRKFWVWCDGCRRPDIDEEAIFRFNGRRQFRFKA